MARRAPNRKQSFTVDADAFQADLGRALFRRTKRTERAVLAVVESTAKEARARCPVDTGDLLRSIVVQDGRDRRGYYAEYGTPLFYGRYVEFGTSDTRRKPFVRPPFRKARRELKRRVG